MYNSSSKKFSLSGSGLAKSDSAEVFCKAIIRSENLLAMVGALVSSQYLFVINDD